MEFRHVTHDVSLLGEAMGGTNPVMSEMGRGIKGITGLFFDLAAAEAIALAPFIVIAATVAIVSKIIENAKEKTKELEKEQKEWANEQKEINKLIAGDESGHSSRFDRLCLWNV